MRGEGGGLPGAGEVGLWRVRTIGREGVEEDGERGGAFMERSFCGERDRGIYGRWGAVGKWFWGSALGRLMGPRVDEFDRPPGK